LAGPLRGRIQCALPTHFRLLQSLGFAQADGSYPQLLRSSPALTYSSSTTGFVTCLAPGQRSAEILDDRYGRTATLVATQVPVNEWHARIPRLTSLIRSSTAPFTTPTD
jgi:hypothetical protein